VIRTVNTRSLFALEWLVNFIKRNSDMLKIA
jgi:hypothetical protein